MHDRHVISSSHPFRGKVFSVRVDRVGSSDADARSVDVVEHGGSYAILATTENDEVVLVRQYRHAVGRELWEIPAGTADPEETPVEGAQRELREETGYRADEWRALGTIFMTPGFCDETLHIFHAARLRAGDQQLDDDEEIEVRAWSLADAECMISTGEIADAKTVLGILWLRGSRYQLGPTTSDT